MEKSAHALAYEATCGMVQCVGDPSYFFVLRGEGGPQCVAWITAVLKRWEVVVGLGQ